MGVAGQHIVEKVQVDIDVTSTELAERIKSEVSEFVQNELLPIIETCFDDALPNHDGAEISFRDKIVQLDKLELSIDADSWNVHSSELREKVRTEVEEKLRPLLQTAREKSQFIPKTESNSVPKFGEDEVNVMTSNERLIKTFFHFLKSGSLPWWVQSVEESHELFEENTLATAIAEKPEAIRQLFKNQSGVKDRLLKQFPPAIILQCIDLQLSVSSSISENTRNRLKQIAGEIPKEVLSEVLAVLWKLSESNVSVTHLQQKELASTIFRFGQLRLFQHTTHERQLDKALKLTFHTLNIWNGLTNRSQETAQLKKSIIDSLEVQFERDELVKIEQTQTYQSAFVGSAEFHAKPLTDSSQGHVSSKQKTRSSDENLLQEESGKMNQSQKQTGDVSAEDANNRVVKGEGSQEDQSNTATSENQKVETHENSSTEAENNSNEKSNTDTTKDGEVSEVEPSKQNADKDKIAPPNDELELLQEQLFTESSQAKEKRDLPKEMYVQNAGLVLLNPFLPALFKQLELIDENKQLTQPELASHVLHYAATGREGDFEFEMTFEKYLCGLPPSVSLQKNRTLTQEQKDEVNKMLEAVVEYWSALKSQSIELVRNEFLSRPGKLVVENNNHRLIVERKAFDLLLDKLPWSYSMIKFSWLESLVFVEW